MKRLVLSKEGPLCFISVYLKWVRQPAEAERILPVAAPLPKLSAFSHLCFPSDSSLLLLEFTPAFPRHSLCVSSSVRPAWSSSSQDSGKDSELRQQTASSEEHSFKSRSPTQLPAVCLDLPLESESFQFSVEGGTLAHWSYGCEHVHGPHNSRSHWIIPLRSICSSSAEGSRNPWKSRFAWEGMAEGLGWTVSIYNFTLGSSRT